MKNTDKYYDEIATGYEKLHEDEQISKLNVIAQKLHVRNNSTLLDVGCGTGISTRFFDCIRTGIDPSEKMIEIAQQKDDEGNYAVGKAEQLPFEDANFDYVVSVTAVHNFEDIEKGLREIKRVAKTGKENIVLSILKTSKKFTRIQKSIKQFFYVKKILLAQKDVIFFVEKK